MLCDICQVNEATISYTEIKNGTKKEQHLCKECAAKYTGLDSKHFAVQPGGLLASLLANMIVKYDSEMTDKDMKKTNFICPSCKTTYNEFLKYGKLGCHDCYKTFGLILDPCLLEIQGSSRHLGKPLAFQEVFVDIPEFKPMHEHASDKAESKAADERASDKAEPKAADERVSDKTEIKAADGHVPERAMFNASDETAEHTAVEACDDIPRLKALLKQAVAGEEYEEAARLRDMIRAADSAHGTVQD